MDACFRALAGRHQEQQATHLNIFRYLVCKLSQEKVEESYSLCGKEIAYNDMLSHFKGIGTRLLQFTYYLANGILAYHKREFERAIESFQLANKEEISAVGMATTAQLKFYWSLAILSRVEQAETGEKNRPITEDERREAMEQVAHNQAQLEFWAQHAPANYRHKHDLVEALRTSITGQHWLSMDLFQAAIDGAQEGGFLHEEALARELTAEFYFLRKWHRVANDCLREAYYLYMRWGSLVKVKQLRDRLPPLEIPQAYALGRSFQSAAGDSPNMTSSEGALSSDQSTPSSSPSSASSSPQSSGSSPCPTTLVAGDDYLDLVTLIKNSQAMLSEVDTDRLLGKLMTSVMENSGADRCVLLLKRKDRFLAEASARFVAAGELQISTSSLGAQAEEAALPRTVINYVTTTHDTVQFDDVPLTDPWADDPYIAGARPRSLLCTPIVHMGKLLGALYLENSSVESVFNKKRFWLVSIICSQMGIALQNARLFGRLSKRGAELQGTNTKLEEELAERKKIQAELEKAMELAKAAAVAKDQFLASVSHEIRTPLNAIIGMTGLLLDTQLTETQHEWLNLIELSGNALLSLVNDILDLAKMESGKVCVVMEDCSLGDVVREATAMFVHASQTKGVRMSLRLDPSCPETIHTDKLRLRQVLLHLLSNAVKFTPPGGSVTLSVAARRVNVVAVESEEPVVDNNSTTGQRSTEVYDDPVNGQWDEVHVNVRDTGPGVDRQLVDRLFQHFTQGDASFSRKAGGTGLGLAISKQLVGLLGGRIWLDTSVTDGSSFHFTVVCRHVAPSAAAAVSASNQPAIMAARGSAGLSTSPELSVTTTQTTAPEVFSILVVEDNVANEKLLMMLLKRLGYAADVAHDGLEAVEAWHKKKYAVILMDLQMPNMDGLTASRVIMSECDAAAPQIIAVSANVYASDKTACSAAGMVDFIEKPISRPLLKAALDRCRKQATQPVQQ